MMLRLISKGIIRSYSMRQRLATVKPLIGMKSDCDVCGGLMYNAQRYMHVNDVYFSPFTFIFIFPHHFTLDLDQLDRILEYRFIQSRSYSFPATSVKLEYMFETLCFLWLQICYISRRNL